MSDLLYTHAFVLLSFSTVIYLFVINLFTTDEWKNFLARIGRDENASDTDLFDSASDILELRFWASYRGQTLARTGNVLIYLIPYVIYLFLFHVLLVSNLVFYVLSNVRDLLAAVK